MPYLITTTQDADENNLPPDETPSRRAVATLDEARLAATNAIERANPRVDSVASFRRLADQAANLSESGSGTVGPLPDGTVIEVSPVDWGDLTEYAATREPGALAATLIETYNAAQGD